MVLNKDLKCSSNIYIRIEKNYMTDSEQRFLAVVSYLEMNRICN